ncbi:MAG: ABC transporter permease [Actinomycetaceae bacterium]|nr:ABC transporter permease [Actinomycetaceae bacterium]
MRIITPTPLLIRRVLRRHPVLAIAVALLSFMIGFLGHISAVLVSEYPQQTQVLAQRWNSADALSVFPTQRTIDEVKALAASDPAITEAETTPVLMNSISIPLNGRTFSALGVIWDIDNPGSIGTHTITDRAATTVDNPVWLPEVLRSVGRYRVGDSIEITTPAGPRTFHIQGFFENTYMGVPDSRVLGIGLSSNDFQRVWEETGTDNSQESPQKITEETFSGAGRAVLLEATGSDVNSVIQVMSDIADREQDRSHPLSTFVWTTDLLTLSIVTSLTSSLIGALLLATALLLILVSALVIHSTLRSVLQREQVPLAMLRACGFTTAQAVRSLIITFTMVALVASFIGAMAYLLMSGYLSRLVNSQSGTTWVAGMSWVGVVASCCAPTLVILAVCTFTLHRLRKQSTVELLRGGHTGHSFRRSYLPLTTTPGSAGLLLGLGQALQNFRRSVMVTVTMMVVSAVAIVILGISDTMLSDEDRGLQILLGEVEDLHVYPAADADRAHLEARLNEINGVESVYPRSWATPEISGRETQFFGVDSGDVETHFRSEAIQVGRYPASDDEIAVGASLARSLNLKVGQTWTIDLDGRKATYLVTGLSSGVQQMGFFAYLTQAGLQRLGEQTSPTVLAVNVVSTHSSAERTRIVEEIQEKLGDDVMYVHDQREAILVSVDGYLSALPVVSALITAFTIVTIIVVVALVVGALLREERHSLGVRKALGFTHWQLSSQLLWAVIPQVVIGVFLGSVGGVLGVEPSLNLILSAAGSLGATTQVPVALWIGVPLVLTLVASAVAIILSVQIRHIRVHELVAKG